MAQRVNRWMAWTMRSADETHRMHCNSIRARPSKAEHEATLRDAYTRAVELRKYFYTLIPDHMSLQTCAEDQTMLHALCRINNQITELHGKILRVDEARRRTQLNMIDKHLFEHNAPKRTGRKDQPRASKCTSPSYDPTYGFGGF